MMTSLLDKIAEKRDSIKEKAEDYFANTLGKSYGRATEEGNAPVYDPLMRFSKEVPYNEFEKVVG